MCDDGAKNTKRFQKRCIDCKPTGHGLATVEDGEQMASGHSGRCTTCTVDGAEDPVATGASMAVVVQGQHVDRELETATKLDAGVEAGCSVGAR